MQRLACGTRSTVTVLCWCLLRGGGLTSSARFGAGAPDSASPLLHKVVA
jgi:hypothetical protein